MKALLKILFIFFLGGSIIFTLFGLFYLPNLIRSYLGNYKTETFKVTKIYDSTSPRGNTRHIEGLIEKEKGSLSIKDEEIALFYSYFENSEKTSEEYLTNLDKSNLEVLVVKFGNSYKNLLLIPPGKSAEFAINKWRNSFYFHYLIVYIPCCFLFFVLKKILK